MRASAGGSSGSAGIRPLAASPGLPSSGISGSTGYLGTTPLADVACYHTPASHPNSAGQDAGWLHQASSRSYDGPSCGYRVDFFAQAASQAPLPKTSGLVRRAASSSPPRRPQRAQAESISNTLSRRAKTPSRRRVGSATHPESTGPLGRRVKAASKAACSFAVDEGSGMTGSTGGAKQQPLSLGCTDTVKTLGFPHLRQHRTWRLLRRLVDELELADRGGAGSPQPDDSLLQYPEALQQLLQPLMRLLPLRETLHQLLERAGSSAHADSIPQAEGGATTPPPLGKLRRNRYTSPQMAPQRSAAVRSKSARGRASSASSAWFEGGGGPPSSTSSLARASPPRLRRPLAVSPLRWRGGTGQAGEPSLKAQLDSLIAKTKRGSELPLKPTPGHRQAARPAAVERREGGGSPARRGGSSLPRQIDASKSAKAGGMAAQVQRSPERPSSGRSVSTARHVYPQPNLQVASRLPPGALKHRRSPKIRLLPTSAIDRRQQQQQVRFSEAWENLMRCAPVAPEPPDSSRSADSEDTLKGGNSIEGRAPSGCNRGRTPSLHAAGGWVASSSPWNQDAGFTSVRVLGAVPPSLSSALSIEAASVQEVAHPREPSLQRRGSSVIMGRSENGRVELEEPSGVYTGHQRPSLRFPASRASPLRRHAAEAAPLSASANTEGERQLGRSERSREGRVESVMVDRRDKRLNVAEAMKRTGAALERKPGRVTPREADVEDEAQQQLDTGSPSLRRQETTARLREGRRATPQAPTSSTPRSGASGSPRRSFIPKTKGERTQQASHSKAMTRKDSTAFLLKASSSRGSVVPASAAAGRRVSAPPAPRKPSAQQRPPPSSPPRTRHSLAAGAAEARVGSLSLKSNSTRKKGGKGASAGKAKAKDSAASKAVQALFETSNAPEEEEEGGEEEEEQEQEEQEEEEINSFEGETSPAEAQQTPAEPPYPFLRLSELPLLDAPIRPLPSLSGILPSRENNLLPPKVDDSVTFMHVLDRSDRLSEAARNMATRHAVTNLSSDAPGTMLLIARWMDTTVNAVEADSAAAKDKLPWREVIPPLFVGLDTHRELLSPRLPRNPRVLEELKAFLEAEGFVETQEQKLRQLLASKSDSLKPTTESQEKPKAPTALDIYLDYVLAVAVAYLRLRQQPVVLLKPTRFVVGGGGDESGSSTCCQSDDACCSRDTSLASLDASACSRGDFGCTDTREELLSTAGGSFLSEADHLSTPRAQRRCWSCLPMRGSLKSDLVSPGISGCSTSSLLTRCLSPAARGPPELDLYESTAAQQVRRLVDRMPVLPSVKYLRYLRSVGKRRELETLAVWFAGNPDVLPAYSAFVELLQKQNEAAPLLKNIGSEAADVDPAATDPVSNEREASRMTGDLSQGAGASTNSLEQPTAQGQSTPQQVPESGSDSAHLSSAGNEADSLASSGSISLPPSPSCPQPSPASSLSLSGEVAADQQATEGNKAKTALLPAPPSGIVSGRPQQRSREAPEQITFRPPADTQAASEGAPASSMQPPSWGRPAEPLSIKQKPTGAKATTSASHPRAPSIASSVIKVKGGKKALPAKGTDIRVMQSFDKGGAAPKPASSQGAAQKYSPKLQQRQSSVKELQRALRGPKPAAPPPPFSARGRKSDEFKASHFPAVSPAEMAALSSVDDDRRATFSPVAHRLTRSSTEEAFISSLQKRAASAFRQPVAMGPQNSSGRFSSSLKGAAHFRGPTSPKKGPHVPTVFPRRAAASAAPKRAGGGGPPGSRSLPRMQGARQPDQWTKRAVKLLSEPQMLAEVASLCSRLSALSCCVQPGESGRPEDGSPDGGESLEFIEVAR
ncbi:hypothetical protein Esti_002156 [Eimeria stiedai]